MHAYPIAENLATSASAPAVVAVGDNATTALAFAPTMDDNEARQLLRAERERVEQLLGDTSSSAREDRVAANEPGDMTDSAEPLTTEQTDDAVAATLRERLEAIRRAEERVEAGTFGRSVRSGRPIPEDRLRADPAAELTVEEAANPG